MCEGKAVITLFVAVLASTAARAPIDFHRTLQYSNVSEIDMHQLESYLQTAVTKLNDKDAETLQHLSNGIAVELGKIFNAFKKLNETEQFRKFVNLTTTEKDFDTKLETAMAKTLEASKAKTNFGDAEILQHAAAELNKTLTVNLRNAFIQIFSLEETKQFLKNVTETLNVLNENDRVLAVRALRIVLKENVLKYVPPPSTTTVRPTKVVKNSPKKNGAGVLYKCGWMLAFAIFSQFLF